MKTRINTQTMPELELTGLDGNAFSILGRARIAAKDDGWPKEDIEAVMNEATSGDYDHLFQTIMTYFEVS